MRIHLALPGSSYHHSYCGEETWKLDNFFYTFPAYLNYVQEYGQSIICKKCFEHPEVQFKILARLEL